MRRIDGEVAPEILEHLLGSDSEEDHDEGSGDGSAAEAFGFAPEEEEHGGRQADDQGALLNVAHGLPDLGESVTSVGLAERHLAFGIGVMSNDVWDLFKDEDDPDGGEKSFDDTRGEEGCDESLAKEAEQYLDNACHHDGGEERLKGAELCDLGCDDRREARCGPADAEGRPAEETDDKSTGDTGDDSREEGGI